MLRATNKWLQYYLQKLKLRVPRKSAALSKSIKGTLTGDIGSDVEMEFKALEYFAYQDQGVSGTKVKRNTPFSYKDKMPPASAFKSYANTLGGQFAMAKSIQENGIKPKNFFKDELENDLKDLPEAILEDIWNSFKLNKK
jgi:hypothetical protein